MYATVHDHVDESLYMHDEPSVSFGTGDHMVSVASLPVPGECTVAADMNTCCASLCVPAGAELSGGSVSFVECVSVKWSSLDDDLVKRCCPDCLLAARN